METLNLRRPIYRKTAAYGHFGRDDKDFTWEATDKAAALRSARRSGSSRQQKSNALTCSPRRAFIRDPAPRVPGGFYGKNRLAVCYGERSSPFTSAVSKRPRVL